MRLPALPATALLLMTACQNAPASTTQAPAAQAAPAPQPAAETQAAALPSAPIAGTPEQKVASLGARYANGFVAPGEPLRGTLSEGANAEHLFVLQAGACHRFVAAGDDGVRDLDLVLHDPNSVVVQRDVGNDALPVLGAAAPICPQLSGAYRLEVRMTGGSGAYALQMLQSRP